MSGHEGPAFLRTLQRVPGTEPVTSITRGLNLEVKSCFTDLVCIWVVVKIMVPFRVPSIMRHLIFRVPKKGPYF